MPESENAWFEKLYRLEYAKLVAFAQIRVGTLAQAEDLVQDTFHEALRHKQQLMAHPNPQGWLMQTVKNKIMGWEKERARYTRHFTSLENADTLSVGSGTGYEDLLQLIHQSLEPEEFELFRRLVLEGYSHLEASRELGITVWACQKRLSRIKGKIQKLFPERKINLKILCQLLLLIGNI